MVLMSRHGPPTIGKICVATSFWGRDIGATARSSAREQALMRARPACYVRSSAHDVGTARVVCARPGFWVCALCTQPNFVTVHYLGSLFGQCSWILFMSTVHRV